MDVAIMNPENKTRYLKLVNQEIEQKKKILESIEHGRNTAESAMTSHHDHLRSDLAQDASVVQSLIEELERFRAFAEKAPQCQVIEGGAEFRAFLLDVGETIEAIYCPIQAGVPGLKIISFQSPIGQVIKGLKAGDMFVYKIGKNLMAGQIKDVQ